MSKNKSVKSRSKTYKHNRNKIKLRKKNYTIKGGQHTLQEMESYNTYEGSLFKKGTNIDDVNEIFSDFLQYKKVLTETLHDSYLIKESRRDDFYTYVNEGWLNKKEKELKKKLTYYVQVDDFRMVQEKVYYEIIDLVKEFIKKNKYSKIANEIENVYNSIYNTTKKVGYNHVNNIKNNIEYILKNGNMYQMLAYINKNEIYAWACPITWNILPDEKNVTKYISHLSRGELGIYDYTIYIDDKNDDKKTKEFKKQFKEKYFEFINKVFKTVLPNDHDNHKAEHIWNVELELLHAIGCRKVTRSENPEYYYKVTKDELKHKYGFDWDIFASYLGYKKTPKYIVLNDLNSIKCLTDLIKKKWNTPEWKTYWLFIFYKTLIRFEWDWNEIYYDFYLKFIQGQQVQFPREIYPIFILSFTFNTLLTKLYVKNNYNEKYVNYTKNMIGDLKKIFINKIKKNNWLSKKTKDKAVLKLEKLKLIVGMPEKLREDPLLNYSETDPWYNMNLLSEWRHKEFIKLEGKSMIDIPEIDWNEFKLISTQAYVVNAYYMPTNNSIYIPLGFLQKPFIDLDERGIEYNLARIGYTLGHELSHCLDDMGSMFDENGNLDDWWDKNDKKKFNKKIDDITAQYEHAAKSDGIEFDAYIAVGENLADISGMALAEEYLLLFQASNEDIDIIKKVSLEAFYVYIAIQSRQKIHEKAIPAQLKTNPHPLEKYRCNCPLSRLKIFRSIYNIKKGDGMWWNNTDTVW
jgi:predicted metalloendopeptidase